MKHMILPSIVVMLLSGCATADQMGQVQVGMTKEDVIRVMGPPASVSAKGNTEYLNYSLSETDNQAFYGITRPYYVRLINGRVDSYGRLGDFDSTQKPTIRIETDENVKVKSNPTSQNTKDLYSELTKLKQLRDDGLITQEEFEEQKKRLLERY
jgi:outer membrane protein assembly factor BamE (lipoprotein component of BamABCDE complex)